MPGRILRHYRRIDSAGEPDSSTMDLMEREFEALPTLELSEYRTLVGEIPPPTDDQIRNFATFVSDAKSWYKHLPIAPGVPFYFFIDPCSGLDRVRVSQTETAFLERIETDPRFHYTWMTTAEYRTRFGWLAFCCEAGSELFLPVSLAPAVRSGEIVNGLLDNNPSQPVVYPMRDQPVRVPKEVLEAGRVQITAIVHRRAASVWFWEMVFSLPERDCDWPQETDESLAIARIRERCRMVREVFSAETELPILRQADPEIEALLSPERERMQREMIAAMTRMRDLVYSAV